MSPLKTEKLTECPHCGAAAPVPDMDPAWQALDNRAETFYCRQCGQPVAAEPPAGQVSRIARPGRAAGFWVILLALLALVLVLNHVTGAFRWGQDLGRVGYAVVIMVLVAAGLASGRRHRSLRYLAIWTAIFAAGLVGYAYRAQLAGIRDKVIGELVPDQGIRQGPSAIQFPASADGHFYIRVRVNGRPVRFLVDTGASLIVLSPRDAEMIGFDPDRLRFDQIFETANGPVRAASVRLKDFKLGDFQLRDVPASVNRAVMSHSLLGMTFFRRLKRYDVADGVLTLTWR